ncbi:MAG: hypothetical protein K5923_01335 [Clostridia bacterium]|nr:hypothetical protein [Clostridia bacterium]
MKRAEMYDEDFDAIIEEENSVERAAEISETPAERFKRQYKEFYTDIKLSHKEDW